MKMKKMFCVMVLVAVVCAALVAQEQVTLGDNDFDIRQNPDNTITIVRFKSDKFVNRTVHVVIPETIYGLPVTVIADNAFKGTFESWGPSGSGSRASQAGSRGWGLDGVTIPDTVTTIGDNAFVQNRLTSVTLGSGLQTIGNSAFANNNLTSITFPAGLRSIGNSAFAENNLSRLTLPSGITSISERTFYGNRLTSVNLDGITSIGAGAFANNSFTSITLPTGLTSIGRGAFAVPMFTESPTSVTIPAGIRSVESGVFTFTGRSGQLGGGGANSNITNITLPANVSDSDLRNYGFEDNFISFYGGQGKVAGTYTKNGPIWARSTAGGID